MVRVHFVCILVFFSLLFFLSAYIERKPLDKMESGNQPCFIAWLRDRQTGQQRPLDPAQSQCQQRQPRDCWYCHYHWRRRRWWCLDFTCTYISYIPCMFHSLTRPCAACRETHACILEPVEQVDRTLGAYHIFCLYITLHYHYQSICLLFSSVMMYFRYKMQ